MVEFESLDRIIDVDRSTPRVYCEIHKCDYIETDKYPTKDDPDFNWIEMGCPHKDCPSHTWLKNGWIQHKDYEAHGELTMEMLDELIETTEYHLCFNCKKWFRKVWNETSQSWVIPNKCPHCGHCIGCD